MGVSIPRGTYPCRYHQSFSRVLGCQPHSRYRVPHRKPFLQDFAVTMSRQAVATGTKVATNQTERGKKPLRMTSRFEATHHSFALTCRLVGILGPIVETFMLSVLHTGQHLLFLPRHSSPAYP
jgi:hypothetical protein